MWGMELGTPRYKRSPLCWGEESSRFWFSFRILGFLFPEDFGRIVNETTSLER